jgi:hypothetical protein
MAIDKNFLFGPEDWSGDPNEDPETLPEDNPEKGPAEETLDGDEAKADDEDLEDEFE